MHCLVNTRRFFIGFSLAAVCAIAVLATVWFLEANGELQQLRAIEKANEQKLAVAKRRLGEQETILRRLKEDPAFMEKVLRDKAKYARPGDVIFRFED